MVTALERLGAKVTIDPEGENLIRAVGAGREISVTAPTAWSGPSVAVIHVQGLPNLVHEFVHVVLAARLDHDHGIDYHAIPFSLEQPAGRRVLWEELACSVLSCAYLSGGGPEPEPVVDAWFAEQLEIQPVFYGLEGRFEAFTRMLLAAAARHRSELDHVLGRAYAGAEALLRWGGAPPEVARPARRLHLFDLTRRQPWGDTAAS